MSDNKAWLDMARGIIDNAAIPDGQKQVMLDAVMADAYKQIDPFTMDEIEESLTKVIEQGPLSEEVDGLMVSVNVCKASHSFGFEIQGFREGSLGAEKIHAHYGYDDADAAREAGSAVTKKILNNVRETGRDHDVETGPDR